MTGKDNLSLGNVKQSLAEEYPELVITDKNTKRTYFDIAALMRKKGYIK